jgi:hypothetical protein
MRLMRSVVQNYEAEPSRAAAQVNAALKKSDRLWLECDKVIARIV